MRPLKIIAWIVTILSIAFLFYKLTNLPREVEYAQDSTLQVVYFVGFFLGIALLPGILWIILAVTKPPAPITNHTQAQKAFSVKSSNPEILKLQSQLKSLIDEKKIINSTLTNLKISNRQGVIDNGKFNKAYSEKYEELESVKNEITRLSKRIRAIDLLKEKFKSLDKLAGQGVLDENERESKREELIENMSQRLKG